KAASSTVRLIGPSAMKGVAPANALGRGTTGTRPNDGLSPTTLHQADGIRIEPPASVPSANGTSPSATAAALPPAEPPAFLSKSNGLRDGPKRKLSQTPRNPIVGLLVLPSRIAPAFSMRSANMQCQSATQFRIALTPPNVNGQPGLKSKRSLMAEGTPCS